MTRLDIRRAALVLIAVLATACGGTTEPVKVSTVTISPASSTKIVGETVQLIAVTSDAAGNVLAGRTVTWASSNTSAAIVSGTGLVTAVAANTVTITATSENAIGTASITVNPIPVSKVTISPASSTKIAGETVQLLAVTSDAAGNTLTGRVVNWTSSNTNVGTVSNSGLVTTVSAGNLTITGTSEGVTGTASVVVAPPPVATVAFSSGTLSVVTGRTLQLVVTTLGATGSVLTGRAITYASSAPSVATVNGTGLVSGISPGTTTLTATSEGKSGTAILTVTFSPCDARVAPTLVPGQVVNGTLANTDCALTDTLGVPDGTYFDIYKFVVPTTTTIDLTLRSTAFDAYLFLMQSVTDSTFTTIAQSDDEGLGPNGTDARIFGIVTTPGTYYVLPNAFPSTAFPSPFGAYTLSYVSPYIAGTIRAGELPQPAMTLERVTGSQARSLRNMLASRQRKRP